VTFTVGQLAMYVDGSLIGDAEVHCCGASIDSRSCKKGNVFFALQGEQVDGNEYIEDAVQAGCSAVVTERAVKTTVPVIRVLDARKALIDLAKHRREELQVQKVIAVTGSVGKTTTKDMIASLLGDGVVSSQKSFNNDLGVPLTVLDAEHATFLVAEVGANNVGEIEPLAKLVRPDIAVITCIDKAHLEGFIDTATVLLEKVKLLEAVPLGGHVIVPDDIDISEFELKALVCTVGYTSSADVQIETGINDDGFGILRIGENCVTLSMLGQHNARNGALAIVACSFACPDVPIQELLSLLARVDSPKGRSCKSRVDEITFIDDSYNANPASMRSALELFATMGGNRKVLILGDMLELGDHAHAEHRLLGNAIQRVEADIVVLVGSEMEITSQTVTSIYEPLANGETMQRIAGLLRSGDTVLLKGSRGLELERIIDIKRQTKVSNP